MTRAHKLRATNWETVFYSPYPLRSKLLWGKQEFLAISCCDFCTAIRIWTDFSFCFLIYRAAFHRQYAWLWPWESPNVGLQIFSLKLAAIWDYIRCIYFYLPYLFFFFPVKEWFLLKECDLTNLNFPKHLISIILMPWKWTLWIYCYKGPKPKRI